MEKIFSAQELISLSAQSISDTHIPDLKLGFDSFWFKDNLYFYWVKSIEGDKVQVSIKYNEDLRLSSTVSNNHFNSIAFKRDLSVNL
ncbi:MAG: hypothetical protein EOO44_17995 [Flavobacterium sp.]|nr:MAG: hypothetical protein EOO44_17995 [Flavobacterium sp.]